MSEVIAGMKEHKYFSDFVTHKSFIQFGKYLITGFLSFGLQYLIFVVLYRIAGLWYVFASLTAYIIVFLFNFLMNAYWSFKSKGNLKNKLRLYSILFAFNLVLTYILLRVLTEVLGITPMLSTLAVMGTVVLWNFVIYKKVIYR